MNLRTNLLPVALLLSLPAAGCFTATPNANVNTNANVNVNANGNTNANANRTTPTPSAPVRITYPEKDAVVEQGETVSGKYENIPDVQKLWVVIYIPKVNRYYPQAEPADLQADGTWSSPATFGGPGDSGLKFEAIAVLADTSAQKAFTDYLATSKARKSYIGMEGLPGGARRQHSVTVTRK